MNSGGKPGVSGGEDGPGAGVADAGRGSCALVVVDFTLAFDHDDHDHRSRSSARNTAPSAVEHTRSSDLAPGKSQNWRHGSSLHLSRPPPHRPHCLHPEPHPSPDLPSFPAPCTLPAGHPLKSTEIATMPEADSTRKRSRSPSDADQPKHKRANTGATSNDAAQTRASQSALSATASSREIIMDAPSAVDDTAASTPSPSQIPERPAIDTSLPGSAGEGGEGATTSGAPSGAGSSSAPPPPSANIHMRCLIVTQDASIIIGKGGSHVNEIREKSGARVMVSESIPGNPERILNVSGPLDAVSKVCSAHNTLPVAQLTLY